MRAVVVGSRQRYAFFGLILEDPKIWEKPWRLAKVFLKTAMAWLRLVKTEHFLVEDCCE
jgi:hypothetical protein